MMMLFVGIALFAWIVIPDLIHGLGLIRQPEVEVYDRWVDVQLTRTYVKGYKGIS